MCSRSNWILNNNYINSRNEDIGQLVNNYIKLTNSLKESSNNPDDENISQYVSKQKQDIFELQDKLFENNQDNLDLLIKQKKEIYKKNNSVNINKGIIEYQNKNIKGNENLINMRKNRVEHGENKNDKIYKTYTFLIFAVIIIFIIQVVFLIFKK